MDLQEQFINLSLDKQVAAFSGIVAVLAGIITAIVALSNFRQSILQREAELKWKQASIAKDLVKEIHDHPRSSNAILMLDWFTCHRIHDFSQKEATTIDYKDVLETLPKVRNPNPGEKELYILDCFDWFFYYIDRLEQYIRDGLINFDNVRHIFFPYYEKITNNKNTYDAFMEARLYKLAPEFWARYHKEQIRHKF
ncbi:MAG: hypothetical protein AB7G44_07265 [Bacteroidia bacterium]